MKSQNVKVMIALSDFGIATQILVDRLLAGDAKESRFAVDILLKQGEEHFGRTSVARQQFVPVFQAIKTRIEANNLIGALDQTTVLQDQLKGIMGKMPK